MAVIAYPKSWVQKPPLGAQINWGHPLSQGLVGYWLMNEGTGNYAMNLVNFIASKGSTNIIWNDTVKGKAQKVDGSTTGNIIVTPNFQTLNNNNLSIRVILLFDAIINFKRIIFMHNNFQLVASDNTNNGFAFTFTRDSVGSLQTLIGGALVTQKIYDIVVVVDYPSNTIKYAYINGVSSLGGGTSGWGVTGVSGQLEIGGRTSAAAVTNGKIISVQIWKNRQLSPSEIQQLYLEPFCSILKYIKRFYSIPEGIKYPSLASVSLLDKLTQWIHTPDTIIYPSLKPISLFDKSIKYSSSILEKILSIKKGLNPFADDDSQIRKQNHYSYN